MILAFNVASLTKEGRDYMLLIVYNMNFIVHKNSEKIGSPGTAKLSRL